MEESEIREGFLITNPPAYFEIAKKTHRFHGQRLLDLPAHLLPGGAGDKDGKRRLVFIGDMHGCARELKALLKKLDFDEHTDHLIAVGDVISKGPANAEVLDELLRLNATSVRGNHEDRILSLAPSGLAVDGPLDTTGKKDKKLLRQLSPRHLQYLEDMPLMLRIPALPLASKPSEKRHSPIAEEILVVHGGLVPAVSLEKQDPYFVMNMRAIHTKTHRPLVEEAEAKSKSKPWHNIWCWYNERLFKHKSLKDFRVGEEEDTSALSKKKYPKPQVVIYGHHSREGLQLQRWTKGLDTGCVRGGKLTALVLNAKGKQEIVQVACKDNRM